MRGNLLKSDPKCNRGWVIFYLNEPVITIVSCISAESVKGSTPLLLPVSR